MYFSNLRVFAPHSGALTDQCLVLISPTIHSQDRNYGVTDFGFKGIRAFFLTHKCNYICKSWSKPSDVFLYQEMPLEKFRGTHMVLVAPKKKTKKNAKFSAKSLSGSIGVGSTKYSSDSNLGSWLPSFQEGHEDEDDGADDVDNIISPGLVTPF